MAARRFSAGAGTRPPPGRQLARRRNLFSVKIAFVDQGYTGDTAANEAGEHGVELHVVKLPEAKRGFVLLPRRWVVERSFGWAARFRRLARAYEKLPQTLAGLHYVAFAMLMLPHLFDKEPRICF